MDEKGLRDSAGVNAGVSLSGLCNLEEVADCHIEVKCSLVLPGVAEITPKDTEGLDELARMELGYQRKPVCECFIKLLSFTCY